MESMSLMIWIIDIIFIAGAAFNIYWQSQITLKAKYKYTPIILSVIVVTWIIGGSGYSLEYIIMIAAFLTTGIMNGVGGIGTKRIVNSGFFSNVYDYKKLAHITLIPLTLGTKERVVAIFNINARQSAQMIFNKDLFTIKTELEKHVGDSTEIEIGSLR
ncbi:hypothetical protein RD055328_12110 [Companilactobacillus sp. RD055328]|uniref:hypothetical protein n=1 Tax=Companilactobacillus sp. RD055328 TaxID=2916634 RepID=UPI001FC87612|nr:hypothetical protein [Companilactobacillus sp. RD055328]GKQ43288.1 hypothetical protein RD055328_12110 [Companilactobacillus sp. RD055328]